MCTESRILAKGVKTNWTRSKTDISLDCFTTVYMNVNSNNIVEVVSYIFPGLYFFPSLYVITIELMCYFWIEVFLCDRCRIFRYFRQCVLTDLAKNLGSYFI